MGEPTEELVGECAVRRQDLAHDLEAYILAPSSPLLSPASRHHSLNPCPLTTPFHHAIPAMEPVDYGLNPLKV